jgi:release factor glutamine methyltransferase
VTDASASLVRQLVADGVAAHEARWLVEEFGPGGDPDAGPALRLAAERRLAGEPLQYVIGHWPFRSLDLDLDPRVLIPRPETEGLVDVALVELARAGVPAPTILDLGCGSGAIGLALVRELAERGVTAALIGVDVSSDAIDVARRNARKHSLDACFVVSSWFDGLDPSWRGHVDLIVSNPPYVSEAELEAADAVLDHEPRGALVAGDTPAAAGFAELARVITGSLPWLSAAGVLVCEHGHLHREAARLAVQAAGFASFEDHDDLAGRPRVMVARRR